MLSFIVLVWLPDVILSYIISAFGRFNLLYDFGCRTLSFIRLVRLQHVMIYYIISAFGRYVGTGENLLDHLGSGKDERRHPETNPHTQKKTSRERVVV